MLGYHRNILSLTKRRYNRLPYNLFVGPLKGGGGVWCSVLCVKCTCLLCAIYVFVHTAM